MRKPWPAKRQRIRLGAGKIEQAPKPIKKPRKKKEKKPEVVEEKEEVKEEQPEAEVSEEEPTEEEAEETKVAEPSEEGIELDRIEGTVKFFNPDKGFGFIIGDDRKEYYVNKDGLKEGVTITGDDKVSFKAVQGDKGPMAEDVEKKEVV